MFIGAQAATALSAAEQWNHVNDQWTECRRRAVDHHAASCNLYLWPFGVALFHLVEDLALDSVAHLAVWRRITYEQNMRGHATSSMHSPAVRLAGAYVLSLYWVDKPAWQGRDLLTALRLMCIPRLLVQRVDDIDESCLAPAMLVERACSKTGSTIPNSSTSA